MSRPAETGVDAPASGWIVGRATPADTAGVVVAAQELLLELGATPPAASTLERVVRELIGDRDAGAVVVARAADGEVRGMLAASWQVAIHSGEFATIQDLWVHPSWRSRSLGCELVAALVEICRARAIGRIEVGLPRDGFRTLSATEAFYLDNGFEALGPRMRRVLT
ncbi:MAG: branched-chain amino acid aminotransferase [Solirubrobacteraceae bacterium]|nr:branched-chain amino acid aminotransferase [Solirubrobacteraceae bacterium]